MIDLDGDDVVYASILTRVEHSELHEQINRIIEEELRLINRHVCHASSLLIVLGQLQAAARHLRPRGDWVPRTLQIQLKRIEKIQCHLETVMDHLSMEKRTNKRKRGTRRRVLEMEKRDDISIVDDEKESFVDCKKKAEMIKDVVNSVETRERDKRAVQDDEEARVKVLEMVSVGETTEVDRAMDMGEQDHEAGSRSLELQQEDDETDVMSSGMVTADEEMTRVENVELEIQTACGDQKREDIKIASDKLPNELVSMSLGARVRVKEGPATFDDVQALPNDNGHKFRNDEAVIDIVESSINLEAKDSFGKIAVKLEVSRLSESAVELDVPDSESEDGFSPVQEIVDKLQIVELSTQLVRVPAAVDQLRTYLFARKYLTVAEVDGYLFAHKCITDEEATEIGHTIEKIISVAIKLPKRPTIKVALYNLLATVEQLEVTLGELPEFLCS